MSSPQGVPVTPRGPSSSPPTCLPGPLASAGGRAPQTLSCDTCVTALSGARGSRSPRQVSRALRTVRVTFLKSNMGQNK